MLITYFVVASGPYVSDPDRGLIQVRDWQDWTLTLAPSECEWLVPGTFEL